MSLGKETKSGELPLCVTLPILCNVAGTRKAMVAEVWEISENYGAWNLRFIKPFNDWEMKQVQNFIGLINKNHIFPWKKDKLVFKR